MRTVFLILSIFLLGITASYSQVVVTFESGYWRAGEGPASDGDYMCAMDTSGPSFNVTIKYFQSDASVLIIHVVKNGWKIPAYLETPVSIEFDKKGPWNFTGVGHYEMENTLELTIGSDNIPLFLEEFSSSNEMVIYFSGNEPPWRMSLTGSNRVTEAFLDCSSKLLKRGSTQPFGTQPEETEQTPNTQPFAA